MEFPSTRIRTARTPAGQLPPADMPTAVPTAWGETGLMLRFVTVQLPVLTGVALRWNVIDCVPGADQLLSPCAATSATIVWSPALAPLVFQAADSDVLPISDRMIPSTLSRIARTLAPLQVPLAVR